MLRLLNITCLSISLYNRNYFSSSMVTFTGLIQGQGHRNEHVHEICHAEVYRHAKLECHTLNTVRYITIIVRVYHVSRLRRSSDLE